MAATLALFVNENGKAGIEFSFKENFSLRKVLLRRKEESSVLVRFVNSAVD